MQEKSDSKPAPGTDADNEDTGRRSSPIWLQLTLGLLLGSIVLMVTGTIPSPASWFGGGSGSDVDASVLIMKSEPISWNGQECSGDGEIAALQPGATIIIFLNDGQKTSSLLQGERTPEGNCRMRFDLDGVSTGSVRFQVGTLSTSGSVTERPGTDDKWVTIEFHP